MTYALGIDLGTTYTAAAVARQGRAEVAALGYRATSVPTVVLLTADGRFLVGDAAERRAGHEPQRVAREFKRRVGDPAPLLLGGTPIAVDRCLAEVLRWVIGTVGETEGGPPASVTVTHPANWGEFKRDVLREALRMVEVPQARLLAEPVAAATWYARAERLAPGRTIAVYDLGGGTFDATVLRHRPDGQFESVGRTEGIDRLGGIDVDEAVFGHALRATGIDRAVVDERAGTAGWPTAIAQLRRACVEAKEALSTETSVTIPVWLPGVHHEVLLQRSELEALVGPLLQQSVDALARVVRSAGLRTDDLDAVLLVGGSSRIPLIGRQVSAAFGRPVAVDAHPKHPVALGAALDADAHRPALVARPERPPVAQAPLPGSGSAPIPAGAPVAYRELPPLPTLSRSRSDLAADRSSRRLQWVATLVTPLAIVGLIVYQVIRAQDLPAGLTTDDASESGPESSVNLLEDPTPALDALAGVYEGPPQVRELVLNPTLATMDTQVPDGSGHVDQYLWHADGSIDGPEPVNEAIAQNQGEPFTIAEIDPAVLPITTQNMLQNCPGDGLELTHVVIERAPSLDSQNRPLMLVYAENPDRGGGGYIAYTLDGSVVANYCQTG
jgi:actin-like ATPase involved in cell morphogenesis